MFVKLRPFIVSAVTGIIICSVGTTSALASTSKKRRSDHHTYVVQSHDTLWTIARHLHISLIALERANPSVKPSDLLVGTVLTLPASAAPHHKQTISSTPITKKSAKEPVKKRTAKTHASKTGHLMSQNLYWMEHVIYVEANAEPLRAQIAVGDVIYHRLRSGKYGGHSVKDVVFQHSGGLYQFPSVLTPQIKETPSPVTIQAAKDVLEKHVDVVPGALVFFNPHHVAAHSWFWSQPKVGQIGNFVFAK